MTKQKTVTETLVQILRFGMIGGLAAIIHYCIAIFLTNKGVPAAWANLVAFVIAFWVSYFGHRYFSFAAGDVSHQQTLPRFILVAVMGFTLNESLLILMLHFTNVSLEFGLPLIIIVTAIFTFVLSRQFAFDTSDTRSQ